MPTTLSQNDGEAITPIDEQIGASSSVTSNEILSRNLDKVRVDWETKGANTTADLEGTIDGSNWFVLQSLSAGVNDPVETMCERVRINASNSGGSGEQNTVHLYGRNL